MPMKPIRPLIAAAVLAGLFFPDSTRSETIPDSARIEDPNPHGEGKNRAFVIHPVLSLVISGLHVSFEGPLGTGLWAYEVPAYLGYSEHLYENATLFTGLGFGLRRYLLDPGMGAFVSPEVEIVNVHHFESGPENAGNLVVTVPSLRMGYKWRWNVATLETGIGFAYVRTEVSDGRWNRDDSKVSSLIPMGHFAAGVPF